MKNTLSLSFAFICAVILFAACSKNGDYTSADHTKGMLTSINWSGIASGYYKGDTVQFPPPDTTHIPWAKAFNHTVSDSSFFIKKINGFAVGIGDQVLRYNTTDSTHGYVLFDTTVAGSGHDALYYFYGRDSFSYEYHTITGVNAATGQYYQTNMYLHTHSH